jgi:hypothetical protein
VPSGPLIALVPLHLQTLAHIWGVPSAMKARARARDDHQDMGLRQGFGLTFTLFFLVAGLCALREVQVQGLVG